MNPLCKIWGHKYGEGYDSPYGIFKCNRCCHETDFNEEVADEQSFNAGGKAYRIKRRLSSWFYNKFRWFFKCHDCGKRFNKHTKDCAPF